MIAVNIFQWIGDLFTDFLFFPFNWFRLGDFNWWSANFFNWLFLLIFLFLLYYWMKESYRFKKEGTEDQA